jgi:glucosamine 6-phosphate synthetase-like amidotransferase/phosphosugar isomerase protein
MLSVVEAEVMKQPAALKSLAGQSLDAAPAGSVFVGAGDSFAASSIACRVSSAKHLALDPYELITAPVLAKGRNVYFVSVTRKTASNLAAAKAVKGLAKKRLAVTASTEGKLVGATDSAIFIPYKIVPRLPGTLSFSLSLLTLLRLAGTSFNCDFSKIHSVAERRAGRMLLSKRRLTYFLGNGPAFPTCLYSAFKLHEILGEPAQACMLEEFGHASLFALSGEDAVNAFCAFDPLGLGERLTRSLNRDGFRASAIEPVGSNPWEQVFYLVFLSQFAALKRAKLKGLLRPYSAAARKKLTVSDSLIY